MKRLFLTLAVLTLLLLGARITWAGTLDYAVSGTQQFGTVDLSTGVTTVINPTTGVNFRDLTRLPGGTLYGMDESSNLRTINPLTGLSSVVGNSGNSINLIKLNPVSGTMFGASSSLANLFTINPVNAAASLVGPLTGNVSANGFSAMAFDAAGHLFMDDGTRLYRINTSNGTGTLLGTIGFSVLAMDYENGALYGSTTDNKIITMDTTTGAGTLAGVVVPGGLATLVALATADPAPTVPEPASFTLVGIGIAGMTVYGWCRRKRAAA